MHHDDVIKYPLVSVLVPLYNHAQFISICLESIVSDDYPNKEIIIIDDGSIDKSYEVAFDWYKDNIDKCPNKFNILTRPNRGVSKTLNELIHKSNGKFLCFVSSDDYLLPGGIQSRIEYLLRHPKYIAVVGDCKVVDSKGSVMHNSVIEDYYNGRKIVLCNEELFGYELIFNWSLAGPAFLASKQVFDMVGGYDENYCVEDWDMYLRLAAKDLIGFIDMPVAAYRVHMENTMLNEDREADLMECAAKTAFRHALNFKGIRRNYLLLKYLHYLMTVYIKGKPKEYLNSILHRLVIYTERKYSTLLKNKL